MRIAAVEPWPGRLRDGGLAISSFLVLLADDARHRTLPVWLSGPDGDSLWQLVGQPDETRPLAGPPESLTARLLAAAAVTVTGVHLDDLDPGVTAVPEVPRDSPPPASARLALAQPALLRSAVSEPYGTAFLRQAIFAEDYRGTTVTFRAEIRTADVASQAGLGLWIVGGQAGAVVRDDGDDSAAHAVAVAGSSDWTVHEVTAEVAGDAQILRFGVFLTGQGRVEVRRAALTAEAGGQPPVG